MRFVTDMGPLDGVGAAFPPFRRNCGQVFRHTSTTALGTTEFSGLGLGVPSIEYFPGYDQGLY